MHPLSLQVHRLPSDLSPLSMTPAGAPRHGLCKPQLQGAGGKARAERSNVGAAVARLGHLEDQYERALSAGRQLQRHWALQLGCVVPRHPATPGRLQRALDAEHVGLAPGPQLQRWGSAAGANLASEDAAILVDLDRHWRTVRRVPNEVRPLVPPGLRSQLVPHHGAIVGAQAPLPGRNPGLDEAERLLPVPIVLGVPDA
mmetsp:Transcript_41632/g.128899  ORF Transcript_41632/g.128899 Transcript_41632/m.128899 type:complete len:200 (-) Transcript_41632:477-1076(-)